MYQQNILDHYKHPRNFGEIGNTQNHAHVSNPLCGDELDFFLEIGTQGTIDDVKFTGRGCAISIASASMLTEKLKGRDLGEVKKLGQEDLLENLGVQVAPARLKCATLALEAVQRASQNQAP